MINVVVDLADQIVSQILDSLEIHAKKSPTNRLALDFYPTKIICTQMLVFCSLKYQMLNKIVPKLIPLFDLSKWYWVDTVLICHCGWVDVLQLSVNRQMCHMFNARFNEHVQSSLFSCCSSCICVLCLTSCSIAQQSHELCYLFYKTLWESSSKLAKLKYSHCPKVCLFISAVWCCCWSFSSTTLRTVDQTNCTYIFITRYVVASNVKVFIKILMCAKPYVRRVWLQPRFAKISEEKDEFVR